MNMSNSDRAERLRQRAVDRIGAMDAPADKFLDAVSAAAALIADAPMSAVTVVSRDRLRVKSSCNLPGVDAARSDAFCSHTVVGAIPFVVGDLSLDPRFTDNPMVVGEPHARFYAGFPMVAAGASIGAVCVIDDRPRILSDEQIRRLERLAQGAAAWFALRGSEEAVT